MAKANITVNKVELKVILGAKRDEICTNGFRRSMDALRIVGPGDFTRRHDLY